MTCVRFSACVAMRWMHLCLLCKCLYLCIFSFSKMFCSVSQPYFLSPLSLFSPCPSIQGVEASWWGLLLVKLCRMSSVTMSTALTSCLRTTGMGLLLTWHSRLVRAGGILEVVVLFILDISCKTCEETTQQRWF